MVDVACRSRWARAARGVVALLIEGGICSGSLLNTAPPRATSPAAAHSSASPPALLLTAHHCVRPLLERWEAEAREAREAAGEGAGEGVGEAAGEATGEEEAAAAAEETAGRFAPISLLFNWQACLYYPLGMHSTGRMPMVCPWCARCMHVVCTLYARCMHVVCTSYARCMHGMPMACA